MPASSPARQSTAVAANPDSGGCSRQLANSNRAALEESAPLLVMEAMKMEHTIVAPAGGTVGEILFSVGDQVTDGAQLLVMEVQPAK